MHGHGEGDGGCIGGGGRDGTHVGRRGGSCEERGEGGVELHGFCGCNVRSKEPTSYAVRRIGIYMAIRKLVPPFYI